MSADTFDILTQKVARNQGLIGDRCRLQGVLKAKAKADREVFYNRLADEAEEGLRYNNLRPAFRAIKRLAGKKVDSAPAPVKKSDGSRCSSRNGVLCRWQEYFKVALNFPPADSCPDLESC